MRIDQTLDQIAQAAEDAALLNMKRGQILTRIEQNADELKLLYNKQAQAQIAFDNIAVELSLLEMKRSQTLNQIAQTAEDVVLLEMKRGQTLTRIEQNADELELLHNKQAQAQVTYDNIAADIQLLQMKRDQTTIKIEQAETEQYLLGLRLADAEKKLADTRLYAGISGVVSEISVDENDSIGTQNSIIRIVDLDEMIAVVELDEIDMVDIKLGQTINLEFDSLPNQKVAAYISKIAVEGRYTQQGIGVVDVEITIDNPPAGLKPGYTFAGGILVSDSEEVLAVDAEAVFALPMGDMSIVMKKGEGEDGEPTPIRVTTESLPDGMVRIITEELMAGDIIVVIEAEEPNEDGSPALALPGMHIPGSGGGPGGGTGGGSGSGEK